MLKSRLKINNSIFILCIGVDCADRISGLHRWAVTGNGVFIRVIIIETFPFMVVEKNILNNTDIEDVIGIVRNKVITHIC